MAQDNGFSAREYRFDSCTDYNTNARSSVIDHTRMNNQVLSPCYMGPKIPALPTAVRKRRRKTYAVKYFNVLSFKWNTWSWGHKLKRVAARSEQTAKPYAVNGLTKIVSE